MGAWFAILVGLLSLVWLTSVLGGILRPGDEGIEPKTEDDEDLDFITKMVTFDFFFFDW